MLTRRAWLVMVLAAAACGGRGEPKPYQTELTEPWTAMNLPIEGGRVVYSDAVMVTIHFDGATVPALTGSWTAALEAAGWKRQSDTSAEDMTSITWSDDTAVVALGVLQQTGRAEVSLTRYPK